MNKNIQNGIEKKKKKINIGSVICRTKLSTCVSNQSLIEGRIGQKKFLKK